MTNKGNVTTKRGLNITRYNDSSMHNSTNNIPENIKIFCRHMYRITEDFTLEDLGVERRITLE
jgi:hypothetical protein